MRKIQLTNEQLQTDLNSEKSSVLKMEGHRSMLERQNKELKSKLSELDTEIRSKTKSTIAALESKVRISFQKIASDYCVNAESKIAFA